MAYTTQAKIEAVLPPKFLTQATDDNADGSADSGLLDAVIAAADTRIDAMLGQRYDVPFTTAPAVVQHASLVFSCHTLYLRRGIGGDQNPWEQQAKDMDAKLNRIARGEEPLAPDVTRDRPSVSTITETSRTYPSEGGIIY